MPLSYPAASNEPLFSCAGHRAVFSDKISETHADIDRKLRNTRGLHTAKEIIPNDTNKDKILHAVKFKVDVLQTQPTKAQELHDRAKTELAAEKYEATPGRGVTCSFALADILPRSCLFFFG